MNRVLQSSKYVLAALLVSSAIVTSSLTTVTTAQEPVPVDKTKDVQPAEKDTAKEPAKPSNAKPGDKNGKRALVQMAILLDSSSSMNGLIHQAKTQLWKVVNEFALAKRGGKSVDLELAFYEYGKNTLPQQDNYVRQVVPLTTNLDQVSEELHALKTANPGSQEWPGAAIQHAVQRLKWSASNDDLKVIFIAGNEPFSQGPIDYRGVCKEAITRGILINTIHCGAHSTGLSTGWKEGSRLADGSYVSIDQNRSVAQQAAPQDAEIRKLNSALNETYIPFGAEGRSGLQRQALQDKNAEAARDGSIVERAASKASRFYRNESWDLVDGVLNGKLKLDKIDPKKLPKEMQGLEPAAQRGYLEEKAGRRRALQKQIQQLYSSRTDYLRKQVATATTRTPSAVAPRGKSKRVDAREALDADAKEGEAAKISPADRTGKARSSQRQRALGDAVIETLKKQAAKKNIRVDSGTTEKKTEEKTEEKTEKKAEKE